MIFFIFFCRFYNLNHQRRTCTRTASHGPAIKTRLSIFSLTFFKLSCLFFPIKKKNKPKLSTVTSRIDIRIFIYIFLCFSTSWSIDRSILVQTSKTFPFLISVSLHRSSSLILQTFPCLTFNEELNGKTKWKCSFERRAIVYLHFLLPFSRSLFLLFPSFSLSFFYLV